MKQIVSLFLITLGFLQLNAQTAVNFNTSDCSGTTYNLYSELDAGNVIILCWVMPCGSCIGPSLTANNVATSFDGSHPGRVKMYLVDDYANTNCTSLNSWAAGLGIKNIVSFSDNAIKMSDYGTDGMPKVVVVGGPAHKVYFNANNTLDGFALQDSILSALNAGTTGIRDKKKPSFQLSLFPNPLVESSQLFLELKESGDAQIRILSMDGTMVYNANHAGLSPGQHKIPLTPALLSKGIYLLSCIIGDQEVALRLALTK